MQDTFLVLHDVREAQEAEGTWKNNIFTVRLKSYSPLGSLMCLICAFTKEFRTIAVNKLVENHHPLIEEGIGHAARSLRFQQDLTICIAVLKCKRGWPHKNGVASVCKKRYVGGTLSRLHHLHVYNSLLADCLTAVYILELQGEKTCGVETRLLMNQIWVYLYRIQIRSSSKLETGMKIWTLIHWGSIIMSCSFVHGAQNWQFIHNHSM